MRLDSIITAGKLMCKMRHDLKNLERVVSFVQKLWTHCNGPWMRSWFHHNYILLAGPKSCMVPRIHSAMITTPMAFGQNTGTYTRCLVDQPISLCVELAGTLFSWYGFFCAT